MLTSKASMGVALVLVMFTWQAQEILACRQEKELTPRRGRRVTPEDVKALEERVKKSPDDSDAREALIRYYFEARIQSRAPELEEKREQHILWLIEHRPESELAGSPESHIHPTGFSGSTEGYQRGKQLWLQQVEKHPDNPRILRNAAQFVSLWDRTVGRVLLERTLNLDPSDWFAASSLAQSYMHERMIVESAEEKAALAQKALSILERALGSTQGEMRFYALADTAAYAFEAGDLDKADRYSSELLQSAEQFKNNWNYGNAIHKGNIILGRIALRRGDISGAKEHLLAAGETPGSPQLNSFGPNMTLAKELLEKGERDAVVTYLQSCEKFWKMHEDRLTGWIDTVKAGGTPDFGANLMY